MIQPPVVPPPSIPTSPAVSAPVAPSWVRLVVRVALVVVACLVAGVVWSAVAATTGHSLVPGRSSPTGPRPALVLGALGSSLKLLVPSLVLGVGIGFGLGALGAGVDRLQRREPVLATLAGLAGWVAQLPWAALSPFVMAAILYLVGMRERLGPPAAVQSAAFIVTLAGLPALLVAAAVRDRWRTLEWRAGVLAGVGAAGRSLVFLAGSLVLVEAAINWPGVGRLLLSSAFLTLTGASILLVLILLALGFVGHVVGVLADGLAGEARAPDPGAEPAARAQLVVALLTLALPLLLLLLSVAVGSTAATQVNPGGRTSGPLGGDPLGRDVFGLLMVGLRNTIGGAIAAAFLAALVGCTWGGVAALAGRAGRAVGSIVGDVLVAPAWVAGLVPLVPAVLIVMLATSLKAPLVLITALLLAPRIALGVRDLVGGSARVADVLQAAAGMTLLCVGVAFVVLVGLGALGLTRPPDVSLGETIRRTALLTRSLNLAPLLVSMFLVMATAGPCLFAGWALLRPCRAGRARAWALLNA